MVKTINEIVKKSDNECKNVIKHLKQASYVLYFVVNDVQLIRKTINEVVRII